MLFHISDVAGIERFEPRPSDYTADPVVWAIDDDRLRNYLLPRDCPRVTFYAGPQTTAEDRTRFLGSSHAIVAIEQCWLDRLHKSRLFRYHLPAETFECIDACAGYYVSRRPVVPTQVDVIDDAIGELQRRNVELRIESNLWPLRDAVAASTLMFSIIRMRNAQPRTDCVGGTVR
ncbi:MAG TPA: hypothetical protein VH436_07440 [Vicinamibacterales bacterium]|jgi:hypothetical protein